MGNARWDATDWGTYATAHVTGKPAAAVFTSRDLKDAYNRSENVVIYDNALAARILSVARGVTMLPIGS
jgi:hypothetical protein